MTVTVIDFVSVKINCLSVCHDDRCVMVTAINQSRITIQTTTINTQIIDISEFVIKFKYYTIISLMAILNYYNFCKKLLFEK